MDIVLIVETVKAAFWIVTGGCVVAAMVCPLARTAPGSHRASRGQS